MVHKQTTFRLLTSILVALMFLGCAGDDDSNKSAIKSGEKKKADSKSKAKISRIDKAYLTARYRPSIPDECDGKSRLLNKEVGGLQFHGGIENGHTAIVRSGENILLSETAYNLHQQIGKRGAGMSSNAPLLTYEGFFGGKTVKIKNGSIQLQRQGNCIYKISFLISVAHPKE